jgi:PAS domain S-box-containing protein
MVWSIENKIKVGVALTLIVLLVNALLSFRATRTLIDYDQLVRHSYDVISELERTLSMLKDAETGERGYIITGDDAYLQPYEAALKRIDGHILRLNRLTADNPNEQVKISALEKKVADCIASLKTGIELRKSGNAEGARQLVASGAGKRMMDDLREYITGMEAAENQLLNERKAESHNSQRNIIITFVVATLIACAVLVATTVVSLRGIQVRKRAEDRGREQRHLFEVTLSSIADGVMVCDINGLITFLNPVAQALTGWSQEEAAGQPLSNVFTIVNEDTRQAVDNPALRAIREGAIVGLANHTVLITKLGTETPIDDSGAPIKTAAGKLLGAVLVFRDITSRRRAETERAQLLAATENALQRAESANLAKDNFLAILSHELRTPLTSVFGWIQLLRSRDIDEAMKAKALEVIDRNIRVQTNLIDDLLNVSQIVAGTFQIRRQMINPLQTVKAAIEIARPLAVTKGITLACRSEGETPIIWADPARVQQIVGNLLSNSIKFTPKGGSVLVQVRQVRNQLEIRVTDTGQGISPQFLPQVFNRFTQADQSATRSHGGLGLGLALVRQLVELHGGTVSAESAGIGKGSTFTINFPLPDIQRLPATG